MRTVTVCSVMLATAWCGARSRTFGGDASQPASGLLRVYQVNKSVAELPEKEDLSTPESAYAVVNRVMASGDNAAWRRISVKRIAGKLPSAGAKKQPVKPENAKMWLNARIVEVRIFRGTHAAVISQITNPSGITKFDKRTLGFENGRWLNAGQDYPSRTLDEARAQFAKSCAYVAPKHVRPSVKDPESYLKPFVKFLKTKGEPPKSFVMKALARHKVIIMGEIHHRPRYWAFNASLVSYPAFPKAVGTIYMELPLNDQPLVETFLAAETLDTMPVIETLRDVFEMGWPDQPMLDFFVTVWKVNRNLPADQRLRIVLVDMQRPWKKIKKRQDWRQYDVDRDRYMADNILRDLREHPNDQRNVLFLVGVGHTMLDLKYADRTTPMQSAAWHLREKLGTDDVFAIMQHLPVMTNMGRVDGRLCLGLFDAAFAKLGNRAVAFPLDTGPFGRQVLDAFPDRRPWGTFRDGYSAYVYLGRLEDEIFSPLIPGFYTEEHLKEIDRRYRLMYGKGWARMYKRKLTVENFIAWMGNSWGRPRRTWSLQHLGPVNAWHHGGSDWKTGLGENEDAEVLERPEEITRAARRLFEAIRNADYAARRIDWRHFLPKDVEYQVRTDYPGWVRWIRGTFKDNPIKSVMVGEAFKGDDGRPTVPYMLGLRDGTILRGNLPFKYDPRNDRWIGVEGLDWHLRSEDKPVE